MCMGMRTCACACAEAEIEDGAEAEIETQAEAEAEVETEAEAEAEPEAEIMHISQNCFGYHVNRDAKRVATHDFSGIGATVEQNTKNDAKQPSGASHIGCHFLNHLGKSRQRKTNIFWGRLSKQCFLISGAFGGRSRDYFWRFFVKN